MLLPSRTKFRTTMRGVNKGLATRGYKIAFGDYALKSDERGYLTSRQIESARKAISHKTKRGGKLWIRVFPHKPISKKPNETRMGSGKSPVDHYAAVIKPGTVIFEMAGVTEATAKAAFRRAADKLPMKTRFVDAENQL
ncbi:50S ribosomal protein L16 [candidate division WWE3 bacterium]|jgi:large subunit ribosomal protein L16|nr:50S ribosomal protein L16 [candidate division WWE3 bacterium]MBT7349536.1 50S ribosomal protein L16 [candidate division WWE3 bacterium]